MYIPMVFLLCYFSTSAMFAVIWVMQLVHYPLFAHVGAEQAIGYSNQHVFRISLIVLPLMLLELLSSLFLSFFYFADNLLFHSATISLILIWLSTFAIQSPIHNKLCRKADKELILSLVKSNWIRTLLWTYRVIVLSFFWLITV